MKTNKTTSGKLLTRISAVCLLFLLLSSCLKDHNNYYVPPVALVTFIQASPDQPPLDFYLDNNKVNLFPINYGDNIDYFRAHTGKRTANFYSRIAMSKILSDTIHLNSNTTYSLFLANTTNHPEIVLLIDSISKPAAGNATIRFINLSPDAPAVDLAVKGGAVLISNKSFKNYTSFLPIQGDMSYTFEVRQQGTNTVLATLDNVTLNSNFVYTIWFHGLANATNNTDKLSTDIINNAIYY
jgi:hypothetical protein